MHFHSSHLRKKMFFKSLNHFIVTILKLAYVVPFNWMSLFPFLPGELLPTYSLSPNLIIVSTINLH